MSPGSRCGRPYRRILRDTGSGISWRKYAYFGAEVGEGVTGAGDIVGEGADVGQIMIWAGCCLVAVIALEIAETSLVCWSLCALNSSVSLSNNPLTLLDIFRLSVIDMPKPASTTATRIVNVILAQSSAPLIAWTSFSSLFRRPSLLVMSPMCPPPPPFPTPRASRAAPIWRSRSLVSGAMFGPGGGTVAPSGVRSTIRCLPS